MEGEGGITAAVVSWVSVMVLKLSSLHPLEKRQIKWLTCSQKIWIHSAYRNLYDSGTDSSIWMWASVCVLVLFYICAFPCSLSALWVDSCVAMVFSTDVAVYNETMPQSPPCSPCCEAAYIRLLSRAGPEVICPLYESWSELWLLP